MGCKFGLRNRQATLGSDEHSKDPHNTTALVVADFLR